MKEYWLYTRTP